MKRKITLFIIYLLFTFANSEFVFAQNTLSKNILTKATNNPYTSMRVSNRAYFFYHKNLSPTSYHNCLIETNSPKQLYSYYSEIIRKIFRIGTFFYNDIFLENREYSEKEIDEIITKNNIDLFIKIGYDQDVYNAGSKSTGGGMDLGQLFPDVSKGLTINSGRSKNLRGKVVSLYVDFYDKQIVDEPILKIIGLGFAKNENEYTVTKEMIHSSMEAIYRRKYILRPSKYKDETDE